MSGLIAIVGRPNVGKSALFNRVVGRRIAIVHNQPGVTRDRISAEAEWRGRPFTLVDTGGIGLARGEKTGDAIAQAALAQVQLAIDAAQIVILVVNVQEGLVPLDLEVAQRLRAWGKPVLVAANKDDTGALSANAAEFARLGFQPVFPVSAIHGKGIEELLDAALEQLPHVVGDPGAETGEPAADGAQTVGTPERATAPAPLKLAVVGRPNVGKSSLVNALTQSDRVVVSPIPGTTRDSIDVPFEVVTDGQREQYVLIDTAGLRKERRVDNSIEFYSVKRAEDAIARSDIAVFVLDALEGINEQDKKIADKIVSERKACIVVVNKWDLVGDQLKAARRDAGRREEPARRTSAAARRGPRGARAASTLAEFGSWIQEQMFFLDYAPVIFTSATSRFQLPRLLEAVRYVAAQLQLKVPTALLNRTLQEAIATRQPVSAAGHHLKFFYATQIQTAPPTFLLFVNRDELFAAPYKRYLAGVLRRAFGFEGCPIVLIAKARPKTIEPKRRGFASAKHHRERRERSHRR